MPEEATYSMDETAVRRTVRMTWLKVMYAANLPFALFGAAVILVPETMRGLLGVPSGDPVHFGIAAGAVPLAFGVAGLLGLRSPLRLCPVLALQATYKSVFLAGVVVPLALQGRLPGFALPLAGLFVLFVAGDVVAVPFPYLLGRESASEQ